LPESSGRELLDEWRKLMESVAKSAASIAGRPQASRQLQAAMRRQLELVTEVLEREQGLRREIAKQLVAPVDAVFDLLEQSGATLRRQAESIEAAGRALEETAALMKDQAELFSRTIGTLRQPAEVARAAAGLDRRPTKPKSRRSSRSSGRKSSTSGGGRASKSSGTRSRN
jgi:ABC-type transporter Mla subunit MlaD